MMPGWLSSAFLGRVPGVRRGPVPGRTALGHDPAGGRSCLRMERYRGKKGAAAQSVELGVEHCSYRRRAGNVLHKRNFAEVVTRLRAGHLLPVPLDREPAAPHDV